MSPMSAAAWGERKKVWPGAVGLEGFCKEFSFHRQ